MKLKEIMTPEVTTIEPDASVQQAAQMMASLDIGLVPVMSGDEVVGVLTDRDIAVRAGARGLDPKRTQVRSVMTESPICGTESQDVTQGAKQMMNHRIRRLLILNDRRQLVGIVALGDLVKALDDKCLAGEVLLRISETLMPMPQPRA